MADRSASLPPQELSNLLLAQANLAFFHPQALAGRCGVSVVMGARWLSVAGALRQQPGTCLSIDRLHCCNGVLWRAVRHPGICSAAHSAAPQSPLLQRWRRRRHGGQPGWKSSIWTTFCLPSRTCHTTCQWQATSRTAHPQRQVAGGRWQLQRCVDFGDIATLQQELPHRLGTVDQPLAGYTPTCQAICRGVWALAVLQVRGALKQARKGCTGV